MTKEHVSLFHVPLKLEALRGPFKFLHCGIGGVIENFVEYVPFCFSHAAAPSSIELPRRYGSQSQSSSLVRVLAT